MAAPQYRIKNWSKFQHYNKPKPAWIKLHRTLLDDKDFHSLDSRSRALLVMLWLIAAESDDGTIPGPEAIAWRLRLSVREVSKDINTLGGYLEPLYTDSRGSLASDRDREREERETETPIVPKGTTDFDEFWNSYPKKVGKEAARKAWGKHARNGAGKLITAALSWQRTSEQWTRDAGQYIPNPATYLNQHRWEDEPEVPARVAQEIRKPIVLTEEEQREIKKWVG